MSRSRTGRWGRRAVWGTFAVVCCIGCNPLHTIGFLTHKDVKVPAEAPLEFKDGPKKKKEEVVVALFITQGGGQSLEFAGAEGALASEIAKKLPEMAKENKQKVNVLAQKDVNKFKMQHTNWKLMHPSERGKHLKADFVLDIQLDKMSMFQPGSLNQYYEGRADVTVDVYDVDAGPDEAKYTYVHPFAYPKTGWGDTTKPVSAFRREFLENLAVEICRHHIDYNQGSTIAGGR